MPDLTEDEIMRAAAALAVARHDLDRLEKLLSGLVSHVCNRLSVGMHDHDWYRISAESRVKDASGVARALKERGVAADQIWQIDDIVGTRAVVVLQRDATRLATALMDAEELRLVDRSLDTVHDPESGYRAIHIKGWLDDDVRRVGCEIQVRTELQDAFAVVSRTRLYKATGISDVVVKAATMQADHLAVIDRALELICDLVTDYQIQPRVSPAAAGAEPEIVDIG